MRRVEPDYSDIAPCPCLDARSVEHVFAVVQPDYPTAVADPLTEHAEIGSGAASHIDNDLAGAQSQALYRTAARSGVSEEVQWRTIVNASEQPVTARNRAQPRLSRIALTPHGKASINSGIKAQALRTG